MLVIRQPDLAHVICFRERGARRHAGCEGREGAAQGAGTGEEQEGVRTVASELVSLVAVELLDRQPSVATVLYSYTARAAPPGCRSLPSARWPAALCARMDGMQC